MSDNTDGLGAASRPEQEAWRRIDESLRPDESITALQAAVTDERERCARLVEMRAEIARESARAIRKGGRFTVRTLWPFLTKREVVAPRYETAAREMDQVAIAFAVVAECIRKGYDPRRQPGTESPTWGW
jgi:hypothetical protein